ncbi:MAG: class I SAM-dependent methyltransferase [Anaerolineae bacterium]|jgi:SAM-dependent methyltransferase|nr:class I SAM-dependent methyltransferase [Anaerolineae bacterium]
MTQATRAAGDDVAYDNLIQRTTPAEAAADVRRFYDRHPYPPPVTDLDRYRQLWLDPNRRRADYHLLWPAAPYREDMEILIAGCGTSQAARYALRQPEARPVVGIDISVTSIEHTRALKGKYNLTNLELQQLPVERAGELDRSFDKIVCTGVLHHLPDPEAGLRALRSVLKPEGAMHLMVYAPYGRTGIYMLQEYARRLGIGTSDEEIQDLATTLMELPAGHPLEHLLREAPDFRRKAALADALLHPQDRAYSVPQFFEYLERAGLTFGRWLRQAPYLAQCSALATTPHGSRLAQLSAREQYAAVELFRGTMVRHSVVAYRPDRPGAKQPIRFDDDRWLSYVPIRLPQTRIIEERLPPGAAAVLINQSHTYPDLYLPINAQEKRLFEAIDGTRTIAEIGRKAATQKARRQQQARNFFERLWQWDQVVFDASHQLGRNGVK